MAEQKVITITEDDLNRYGVMLQIRVEVGPDYYRTVSVTPVDLKELPLVAENAVESIVKQIKYDVKEGGDGIDR